MTIAVTGGNGEFGRAVLENLVGRVDGPLVATVREVDKVRPLPGVEYRSGDFDHPDALRAALTGVHTVLINATFFGTDVSLRQPRVTAAIRTAAEAAVDRIVLTGWPDPAHTTHLSVQDYPQLEALVSTAGPAWTIIRLAANLADALARDVVWGRAGGELVAPAASAQVTPAALTDLAEAAAAVVAQPGRDGAVLELTGPDPVTWQDLAKLAGVPFRPVGDEEYRDYLARFDLPPVAVRQLIELYVDYRDGWTGTPTPTLADLIGRPPVPGIEAVNRRVARFPAG